MLKDKISFYKVCFDSMQVGILVCNENNEIVLANMPLTTIFGYSTEEFMNLKICDLFKDCSVYHDFLINPTKRIFKYGIEIIGVKKNGTEFPIEFSLGKIEYEGNYYFKALLVDISLRKKKEVKISNLNTQLEEEVKVRNIELEEVIKQLKKSLDKEKELNQLKTKFIALTSHEFKTPLSAILSSTELIVKYADLQLLEKRDQHLIKVKSMIHHLNNMLDDLLTLENIETGKINRNYSTFRLSSLIEDIYNNIKPFIKSKQKLTFKNEHDEVIFHDAKIINVILTNLLFNAIKYSDDNGKIKVKITTNNSYILFTIEDEGIGIPENEQRLIFNRFFRAKNALYYPGTGIGLNIVKGYVNSLDGSISFESTENKGTIFKVSLPKLKGIE